MASYNISIKEDAYDFLKRLKVKDKSFSDVILEFKENKKDIMAFFGTLKNIDWEAKEPKIKEFRNSFNKKLK